MIIQENIPYTADEIKTMVKTCEKYNKALEKAEQIYNSDFKPDEAAVLSKYLPMLFPELKESKDERISKVIYGWIYSCPSEFFDNGFSKEEMLDWLEKQGEQKFSNIPSRETILAVWELGNDWKELTNGSISTEHGTQLEYIQKHWQESSYYDNIGDNIPTLTDKDYDKLFINCKREKNEI